jgi:hypothetical protein
LHWVRAYRPRAASDPTWCASCLRLLIAFIARQEVQSNCELFCIGTIRKKNTMRVMMEQGRGVMGRAQQ